VPKPQLSQSEAPVLAVNCPAGQLEHAAAPPLAKVPLSHWLQDAAAASENVPAPHLLQPVAPALEYRPALQLTSAVAPAEPQYMPAAQAAQLPASAVE